MVLSFGLSLVSHGSLSFGLSFLSLVLVTEKPNVGKAKCPNCTDIIADGKETTEIVLF
jgi:hypothetical protein